MERLFCCIHVEGNIVMRGRTLRSELWIVAIISTTLLSCKSNEELPPFQKFSNPYYPLEQGDVWVYLNEGDASKCMFREVRGTKEVNGKRYDVVEESTCDVGRIEHVRQWRVQIDTIGDVYALTPFYIFMVGRYAGVHGDTSGETSRALLYRQNASRGDEWHFDPSSRWDKGRPPAVGSRFHVRCERRGEFTLSDGRTFPDCIVYSTDEHEDGFEYVLARDIGLISFVSYAPGGFRYELCAYKLSRR
jgi:hypothetical protein